GISFLGFIFVLAIVTVTALVTMRLFPIYQEYFGVVRAMEQLAAQPGIAQESPSQVRSLLLRRFEVNFTKSVTRDNIKINRDNGYNVIVAYEVRQPMVGNLDVVASFEKQINLLAP
ncbi:MAG: DUF4845 domain-containing protein, partial [Pseudomonadota bacterium]